MPTITDLKFQKRHANRVSVFLDGRYAFDVTATVAAGLNRGQRLTTEAAADLERDDARHRCYLAGIRYLGPRARSRAEIRRFLKVKGFEADAVDHALGRLAHQGYIDDLAFARQWVRSRRRSSPRGAFALRHELMGKGVAEGTISAALADIDDLEAARAAGLKKSRQLVGLDARQFEIKLLRFLAGRGFSAEVCREAARWVLERREEKSGAFRIG